MKIRSGFVTNSSSTSFIVAFDREISERNQWDVWEMMNGLLSSCKLRSDLNVYDPAKDSGICLLDVYNLLVGALTHELVRCVDDGQRISAAQDLRRLWTKGWSAPAREIEDVAEFDKFFERNKTQYIYHFTVEDDSAAGRILERCRLLYAFPCMFLWCH